MRWLPGDDLIPQPLGSFTHAITIRRRWQDVWPWLVQMGAGSRAGWYSYDSLDNGRRRSADRIVPRLQSIAVGALFPAIPGATNAFHVLGFETGRSLVLGVRPASGAAPIVTWAFVLDARTDGSTRLIVRARGGRDYSFHGLPAWIGMPITRLVHFIMERKQLHGIASRAEARQQPDGDEFLDTFMPEYDVAERHHVRIAAPPDVALSAAVDADLQQSVIVRGIIKAREWVLGATPDTAGRPKGLLAEVQSMGWRVLAEKPGREIVVGAVTQPWMANVVFRGLDPDEFRAFHEPGYAKIVWTLRADPAGPSESIFRTETRVATTDATARRKFRWYWARFSPGIVLIRRVLLRNLKKEAERRARTPSTPDSAGRTTSSSPGHLRRAARRTGSARHH
jgi:hypothetical protein